MQKKSNVKKSEKIPTDKIKKAVKAKEVLGKQEKLAKTFESFRK